MKLAAVVGGAECVWDDLAKLEELVGGEWPGLVVAVNEIGTHLERVDHWASLHPEKLHGTDPDHPDGWCWDRQRLERGLEDGYVTWCHKPERGAMRWVKPFGGGSSGMLAVSVAWELGCDKIVCCGCPMDYGGWFDGSITHADDQHFTSYKSHRRAWQRKRDKLVTRVRSMSGWTAELLGEPTPEWLGVDDE